MVKISDRERKLLDALADIEVCFLQDEASQARDVATKALNEFYRSIAQGENQDGRD